MKAGSLIKVTYPTAGFNQFVYEANDYSSGGSLVQPEPVHHSASALSDPGETSPELTTFTIGGIDPTVNGATVYVAWIVGTCTSSCLMELWQGSTRIDSWSSPVSADPTVPLQRGTTYTLKSWNGGISGLRVAVTIHWYERVALTKRTAGGLRRQVTADDGMGNVTVRRYSYQLSDGRSSGWITLGPRYDHARNLISGDNTKQCVYYSRASTPRNPLGSALQVEYSVVTESLGVNGVFGTIQRRFDALCDCANAVAAANNHWDDRVGATVNEWPFLRYTSDAWRRGEPLSTEEFRGSGPIQRATSFTYGNPPSPHPTITFRGLALNHYSMFSRWMLANGPGTPGTWGTVTHFIWANQFLVQTGLKVEIARATTLYDTTATSSISTTQTFTYGNPNHAQLTEVTENNSDGRQRITRMKYPADYPSMPTSTDPFTKVLSAMQGSAHMHGAVIERWVVEKAGTTQRVMQGELTTFKEYLLGQYLPHQRFVFNAPSPVQ
jgi:hypothetical protein